MDVKTQRGYLFLADISGYTFFLANTELEHANIALSFLLESIVEKMGRTLTITKLEGDAVLAFLDEGQLPDEAVLLELIDQTYVAFREKVDDLYSHATCSCKACQAIPTLDLKFVVHRGDFIVQNVAGIRDLLGSDVNLIHRLLKNKVAETTGWRGYALFTRQGMGAIQTGERAIVRQSEAYEHFGEIETFVMDLHSRYRSPGAA